MAPGRNDPCPCGSGKKYKKCCLQKDVETQGRKTVDFSYESHLAMRGSATEKLDRVIVANSTKADIEDFRGEYWDTPLLDDAQLERLMESKEAEIRLSQQLLNALPNAFSLQGLTPARFALTRQPDRFTAPELEFLRAFDEARLTYIQPREFFPETGSFVAEDIFDGRRFTVFDKNVSISGRPHDILSIRLVPFPGRDGYVFEALAGAAIVPEHKEMLLEALEWLRQDPDLGLVAYPDMLGFLKANPIVFYWIDIWMWHERMFPPKPKLFTTDGEELVFIKARFSAADPEALASALARQRHFRHEEEKATDVFTWVNREDRVLGTLRIRKRSGSIELETNSRERYKKWEKKLKSLADITFLEKKEESSQAGMEKALKAAGAKGAAGPVAQPQGALSPETLAQIMPQLREQVSKRWLSERVPALGGITPVEAAGSPEGRKRLVALLDTFENQNARMDPGGLPSVMDVDDLRRRLGIGET